MNAIHCFLAVILLLFQQILDIDTLFQRSRRLAGEQNSGTCRGSACARASSRSRPLVSGTQRVCRSAVRSRWQSTRAPAEWFAVAAVS